MRAKGQVAMPKTPSKSPCPKSACRKLVLELSKSKGAALSGSAPKLATQTEEVVPAGNGDMRIKRLQPVVDASGLDKVGGPEVVKKHMMPSSFAGGLCCMTEDFHDAVAVSQVHGSPDIFTTFACDPEWPERIETLEHGQKAVDGADITIQIHQMKLLDYLHTIRTGQVFGTVLAVVHTVEFQKTGVPHAHILVWQEKNDDQAPALADVDPDACTAAPANSVEAAVAQPARLNRIATTAAAASTIS
ncbi:uncharacterized protein [Triticum aestivum]|uniref:uncharacterized protein isoform X2 n=1 Tax=Triticum aestivum TaxID=4565 RepID=UPI001D02DA30|nr:uncharacterized protein LOC123047356 isoform X2 [Triticum aestivum]